MITTVSVYCSSSDRVDGAYLREARTLGSLIGEQGWTLVFGGAGVGLMAVLANAVKAHGGRVVGVIPEFLVKRGLSEDVDEMIVTGDMRSRKAEIESRADAFVVLPGSIGTLEEMVEQFALKFLKRHTKPIVLVNVNGYFDKLLAFFEQMVEQKFVKPDLFRLFTVVGGADEVPSVLANYEPPELPNKWFEQKQEG